MSRVLKERNSLIAKLGCNKEKTRLQNAQTGRNRHSIKILDFNGFDFLILVIDRNFEQVTVLALQKEEKCALRKRTLRNTVCLPGEQPYLHFVHDSGCNDDTSIGIF